MLATVTPCAPLWLDDDFLLANHRGANVVMAASRHTKIQLRFFGVPNDGFFKFYLRSSASSFGRISDIMAWKETSGFSLLGAWFETCTMGICLWVSAWLVRDLKPVRWEFVSENQLGAGAIHVEGHIYDHRPDPADHMETRFILVSISDASQNSQQVVG